MDSISKMTGSFKDSLYTFATYLSRVGRLWQSPLWVLEDDFPSQRCFGAPACRFLNRLSSWKLIHENDKFTSWVNSISHHPCDCKSDGNNLASFTVHDPIWVGVFDRIIQWAPDHWHTSFHRHLRCLVFPPNLFFSHWTRKEHHRRRSLERCWTTCNLLSSLQFRRVFSIGTFGEMHVLEFCEGHANCGQVVGKGRCSKVSRRHGQSTRVESSCFLNQKSSIWIWKVSLWPWKNWFSRDYTTAYK